MWVAVIKRAGALGRKIKTQTLKARRGLALAQASIPSWAGYQKHSLPQGSSPGPDDCAALQLPCCNSPELACARPSSATRLRPQPPAQPPVRRKVAVESTADRTSMTYGSYTLVRFRRAPQRRVNLSGGRARSTVFSWCTHTPVL